MRYSTFIDICKGVISADEECDVKDVNLVRFDSNFPGEYNALFTIPGCIFVCTTDLSVTNKVGALKITKYAENSSATIECVGYDEEEEK